jgi:hypothetical protein
MTYGADIHHRRSVWLQGTMIKTIWGDTPFHYTVTDIDEFTVGATPRGCPILISMITTAERESIR